MAGFKLIQNYLSSESDEEDDNYDKNVQLNSQITFNKPPNTSKQLLPLPDNITSWTVKNSDNNSISLLEDNEDDVDDEIERQRHDGRIRSFKHERGNWATLVYIEYKPDNLILKWMESVKGMLPIDGKLIIDSSHVSLTRTLIFKFHWIESFVSSMKKICQNTTPFTMTLMNVKLYCNEEQTRTFVGIECQCLDPQFTHFMDSLNNLLTEYQLSPFYEDASYHISFLWALDDKRNELKPYLDKLNTSLNEVLAQDIEINYINVSKIHCKIGNKIYVFTLKI